MIGMSDALLYAFTEPATKIVSDKIAVNVAMNWYFIAASVVVLLPTIYWVTMRFVIPRLGSYDDTQSNIKVDDTNQGLTLKESKAVFWANISFFTTLILLIIMAIPQNSFLRNAKTGSLLNDSPIINGIGLIILLFFVPGLVYGMLMKEFKNSKDLGKMLADSMASMGSFIVIVFLQHNYWHF